MKALHFVDINYLQTNIRLFSFGDLSGFVTHTTKVINFRIFRLDAWYKLPRWSSHICSVRNTEFLTRRQQFY